MIELNNSGLSLYLDDELRLRSNNGIFILPPQIRMASELKEVLLDNLNEDNELYFMYRGIHRNQDKELFENFKLRYDITIIPPNKLGREFVKTLGHKHSSGEVYEVLNGSAIYLMQNNEEIISTEVESGGLMYILRDYEHVTINPSNEVLVMSNIIKSDVTSNYEDLKLKKGMSYFLIEENSEKKFIPNQNYSNIALKSGKQSSFLKIPLYLSFLTNPEYFSYL